jgi:poly-gamma-glutamate synthesis protein (capsule biosynthesis protein)
MVVAGDIMLGRGVNNKMVSYGDYSYPYKGIHDELQSADYRIANLECTVTDLTPVPTDPATFYFVSSKKAVSGLVYAGFQTLTVANNHANGPGGHPAFSDMLKNLRDANISVMGGGDTLAEARTPSTQTIKGVKFALLGYHNYAEVAAQGPAATDTSWGLAPAKVALVTEDVTNARAKADIVIPYFHWGIEYTKVPTKIQQTLARAAIDAGADMVLGNHPHWTQGIEEYKGKLIIYSMGNFVFDQDWSRPTLEGMLIHFYWRDRALVGVRFVPTLDRDRCQPRVMTQAEGVGVFQRMWSGTDILASGVYGPEFEP